MRGISFSQTTAQFIAGTKTVTRRVGWIDMLKAGDQLRAVEKGMGLKKGEKVKVLGIIRVAAVWREQLNRMQWEPAYGRRECILEGFPDMSPDQFVEFFCNANGCAAGSPITRIEFERVS